jgi:hypothetical protein
VSRTGQTLRRVTDTSGAVIELTLDAAGKVINSRASSARAANRWELKAAMMKARLPILSSRAFML